MAQERLTREDARILGLETGNVRGHTCKVLLLDGRVQLDDLRSRILARLDRAPRLRQRLLAPRGFGRPVWVDDATFDIAAQVRSLASGRPLPSAIGIPISSSIFPSPSPTRRGACWRSTRRPRSGSATATRS